jgi:hypothetical protein
MLELDAGNGALLHQQPPNLRLGQHGQVGRFIAGRRKAFEVFQRMPER